jgi:hypothetical protein
LITGSGPVTTAGVIAVGNLEARIDGQLPQTTAGRLTVAERAELVELGCADPAPDAGFGSLQRRGRDSNPRWTVRPTTVFERRAHLQGIPLWERVRGLSKRGALHYALH